MPQNLGHNLLIRGGLRAYALTLPLLGFKCTWYEIKSRDMNEKGNDFIFYNKPYYGHGLCNREEYVLLQLCYMCLHRVYGWPLTGTCSW